MTAVLPDTDQMPDLDAVVPCECPRCDEVCPDEAEILTWNYPCGHEPEALCKPCAAGVRDLILKEGCRNCGGPIHCDTCYANIEDLGFRTL